MPSLSIEQRVNGMYYGIGDFVTDSDYSDYMFKCVDIIKSSSATAPDLTYAEAGDFFVDGSIVWVAKEYSSTNESWSAFHTYSLKDSVNVPTSSSFSLECVSYTGTTGTEENLIFEQEEYTVASQTTNTFSLVGDGTYYFRKDDVVTAEYAGGAQPYVVVSSTYDENSDLTIVTVSREIDPDITYETLRAVERGTKDGEILWKLLEDTTNIQYPWNGYVVFDHTLEIIE
jgi:hypothetical protein